jgi:hypothetical protein
MYRLIGLLVLTIGLLLGGSPAQAVQDEKFLSKAEWAQINIGDTFEEIVAIADGNPGRVVDRSTYTTASGRVQTCILRNYVGWKQQRADVYQHIIGVLYCKFEDQKRWRMDAGSEILHKK